MHGDHLIFKFQGVDTISDAEKLAGAEVSIPFEQRAALAGRRSLSVGPDRLRGFRRHRPLARHGQRFRKPAARRCSRSAERSAHPFRQIHLHQNRSREQTDHRESPRRSPRLKRSHSGLTDEPRICVHLRSSVAKSAYDFPHPHHLPRLLPRPPPIRRRRQSRRSRLASRSTSTISAPGRTTAIAPSTIALSAAAKACC